MFITETGTYKNIKIDSYWCGDKIKLGQKFVFTLVYNRFPTSLFDNSLMAISDSGLPLHFRSKKHFDSLFEKENRG